MYVLHTYCNARQGSGMAHMVWQLVWYGRVW